MKRIILLSLLCLITIFKGYAQVYYEYYRNLDSMDLIGLNINSVHRSLDSSAFHLVQSFPEEFRDDFRVYGVSFYFHTSEFVNGIPPKFQEAIDIAQAATEFYLVFGREKDEHHDVTKLWTKLHIPSTSDFECLTASQLELLSITINGISKQGLDIHESSALTEIDVMNYLDIKIENVVDCCVPGVGYIPTCDENITPLEISEFFRSKNYTAIPVRIVPIEVPIAPDPNKNRKLLTNYFTDVEIEVSDEVINIGNVLEYEISNAINAGVDASGFCTTNADFNDEYYESQLLNEFNYTQYQATINSHLWENPDENSKDTLYIKFFQNDPEFFFDLEEVIVEAPVWECGPNPNPPPAPNLYWINRWHNVYYGYHFSNNSWVQGDSVQYTRLNSTADPTERLWGDKGASRTGLDSFEPSFMAWLMATFPKEFSTQFLVNELRSVLQAGTLGSRFKSESNQILEHFIYEQGAPLKWDCDSELSSGISNISQVLLEKDKIEEILREWLEQNDNLENLFTVASHFEEISAPILYGLPLWGEVLFGGTQGIKIQVKSLKINPVPCYGFPQGTKRFDCEILFTLYVLI